MTASGIVFIDGMDKAYDVADYMNYGPNNELYLAPGQAVAFDLNAMGDVASVQLALKSVGGTAKATCYDFADTDKMSLVPAEIATATDLYYDITSLNGKTVVIRNTGAASDAVLSITNVKITYNTKHTDALENTYFTISGEKVSNILDSFNETEEDTDAPDFPSTKFTVTSASLSLEDEVLVNFYFTWPGNSTAELQEAGLLSWSNIDDAKKSISSNTPIELAEHVIKGYFYDPNYNNGEGRYMVQSTGIAAKDMAKDSYYCVYIRLDDGRVGISNYLTYSPKTYALNMLKKATTSDKMKAVCVGLLNYGAAAQKYFDSSLQNSSLMNYELSNATYAPIVTALTNSGYLTTYDKLVLNGAGVTGAVNDVKTSSALKATSKGYSKKSVSVSFEGAFAMNYYFTPSAEVSGDVTFYYWSASDYANAATLTADNATGVSTMILCDDGRYWAQISGIAAKNIDEPYYVIAVYSNGSNTYSTGAISYSIGSYCKSKASSSDANLADLAKATALYGYYANVYFN